jgi:hypothetical protein
MEINLDELKTWIAALSSGNYQQTKGNLQTERAHCCLGVACKVLIPEDKQKLNSVGYLVGDDPYDQPNAPEWLKDINVDFLD